jgi:hypothetical protein
MQTTAASSRGRAEGSLRLRIDRTLACEDLVSQAFNGNSNSRGIRSGVVHVSPNEPP